MHDISHIIKLFKLTMETSSISRHKMYHEEKFKDEKCSMKAQDAESFYGE
jgi:hypothetical protein